MLVCALAVSLAGSGRQLPEESCDVLVVGGSLRRIGTARTLMEAGKGSGELQKLCGIPDYRARKTMEAARRFSGTFCAKAAELVLEADYAIKTSFDDSERILELLVLELAREARNG